MLVVDDVLTTGGSVKEVIAAVKERKGNIIGIGLLVDRSEEKYDFGAPFFACHRVEAISYGPDKCPLCAAKIPLTKPGGS